MLCPTGNKANLILDVMCFGIRFPTSASFRFPHFGIHEELYVQSLFYYVYLFFIPIECPIRLSFILINKMFFFIIIWNNNSVEVTLVFVDYTFSFFYTYINEPVLLKSNQLFISKLPIHSSLVFNRETISYIRETVLQSIMPIAATFTNLF